MAQNDVVEVVFNTRLAGIHCANVLHVEQSSVADPINLATSIDEAIDAEGIYSAWAARTSEETMLTCLKIRRIQPTIGETYVVGKSLSGGISGGSLPPQIGSRHFWQGAPYIKTSRGGHTWTGIPKAQCNLDRLNLTGFNAEALFAAKFQEPMTGQSVDWQWGVWSPKDLAIYVLGFAFPEAILQTAFRRRGKYC